MTLVLSILALLMFVTGVAGVLYHLTRSNARMESDIDWINSSGL